MSSTSRGAEHMQRFWDERAREDAYYYVDSSLEYGATDLERFWADGERTLDALLGALAVQVRAEDRVVDIGCGVGRLTRFLSARAKEVDAIDVSGEMLALARQHNPELRNVRWIQGDGTTLRPLEDASVDVCISWVVFQHIPDADVILGYVGEMGRVLRPGGWAGFQVSDYEPLHERPGPVRRVGQRLRALTGRAPRGRDDPAWRGTTVGLDRLRRTAAQAGLVIERVEGEGQQYALVLARRE